jgi:hypothetical protein
MKFFYKFFATAGLIALTTACTTTSEPAVHVADCHTKDGMLVNSSKCVTTHNDIVVNQVKARAARRGTLGRADRFNR